LLRTAGISQHIFIVSGYDSRTDRHERDKIGQWSNGETDCAPLEDEITNEYLNLTKFFQAYSDEIIRMRTNSWTIYLFHRKLLLQFL
jgi:hypothetical protein